MQGFVWTDGHDIYPGDLTYEQTAKENEITRRTTDLFAVPGIGQGYVLVAQANNIHVNSLAQNGSGTYGGLAYDGLGLFVATNAAFDQAVNSGTDTGKWLVVRQSLVFSAPRLNPETGTNDNLNKIDSVTYVLTASPLATDVLLCQINSFSGSTPVLGQTVPSQRSASLGPIIPAGYITGTMIANGAVGNAQLAPNSVSTADIQNGAVTLVKLGSDVPNAAVILAVHQLNEHSDGIVAASSASFLTATINTTGINSLSIVTNQGTGGGIYLLGNLLTLTTTPPLPASPYTLVFTDVTDTVQTLQEVYVTSAGVIAHSKRAVCQSVTVFGQYFQMVDASEGLAAGTYPIVWSGAAPNALQFNNGPPVFLESGGSAVPGQVVRLFSSDRETWLDVFYQSNYLPAAFSENITFLATAQQSGQSVFMTGPFSNNSSGFLGYGNTSPAAAGQMRDKRRYGQVAQANLNTDMQNNFIFRPRLAQTPQSVIDGLYCDTGISTGLSVSIRPGRYFRKGQLFDSTGGTFTVADNSTTFIYLDENGVCQQIATTAPTFAGVFGANTQAYKLLKVVTLSGSAVLYVDYRTFSSFAQGYLDYLSSSNGSQPLPMPGSGLTVDSDGVVYASLQAADDLSSSDVLYLLGTELVGITGGLVNNTFQHPILGATQAMTSQRAGLGLAATSLKFPSCIILPGTGAGAQITFKNKVWDVELVIDGRRTNSAFLLLPGANVARCVGSATLGLSGGSGATGVAGSSWFATSPTTPGNTDTVVSAVVEDCTISPNGGISNLRTLENFLIINDADTNLRVRRNRINLNNVSTSAFGINMIYSTSGATRIRKVLIEDNHMVSYNGVFLGGGQPDQRLSVRQNRFEAQGIGMRVGSSGQGGSLVNWQSFSVDENHFVGSDTASSVGLDIVLTNNPGATITTGVFLKFSKNRWYAYQSMEQIHDDNVQALSQSALWHVSHTYDKYEAASTSDSGISVTVNKATVYTGTQTPVTLEWDGCEFISLSTYSIFATADPNSVATPFAHLVVRNCLFNINTAASNSVAIHYTDRDGSPEIYHNRFLGAWTGATGYILYIQLSGYTNQRAHIVGNNFIGATSAATEGVNSHVTIYITSSSSTGSLAVGNLANSPNTFICTPANIFDVGNIPTFTGP